MLHAMPKQLKGPERQLHNLKTGLKFLSEGSVGYQACVKKIQELEREFGIVAPAAVDQPLESQPPPQGRVQPQPKFVLVPRLVLPSPLKGIGETQGGR